MFLAHLDTGHDVRQAAVGRRGEGGPQLLRASPILASDFFHDIVQVKPLRIMTTGVLFKIQVGVAVVCLSLLLPMLLWFVYQLYATFHCQW